MVSRAVAGKSSLLGTAARPLLQDGLKTVFGASRSLATSSEDVKVIPAPAPAPKPFAIRRPPTVLTTLHSFPTLEPIRFMEFPGSFLNAPLRRDILQRAIIFEGDATRKGTASTKWRTEIHGSGRKMRPQKGTGRARIGDKKSPMLRGGGVAHGPHPRDFSTDLPRKVYDMAWRNALSYRYRREELVVVEESLELQEADQGLAEAIIKAYGWGKEGGRTLFVTAEKRENLVEALKELGKEARVLTADDVDVKDLLEHGRVVIEKEALEFFADEHAE